MLFHGAQEGFRVADRRVHLVACLAPAEVVVTGGSLTGAPVRHALAALESRATAGGPIREPISTALLGHGHVLVVSVPLAGSGTDSVSNHALTDLRDRILPATFGKVHGLSYAVTGLTAGNHVFSERLALGKGGPRDLDERLARCYWGVNPFLLPRRSPCSHIARRPSAGPPCAGSPSSSPPAVPPCR